jgi:hypothetical protein
MTGKSLVSLRSGNIIIRHTPTNHTTHQAMIVIFLCISITVDLWWVATPFYIEQQWSVIHHILYGFSSHRVVLGGNSLIDYKGYNRFLAIFSVLVR